MHSRHTSDGDIEAMIEFAPHRVNEPGYCRMTPLHFAADGNRDASVRMLLAAGAEVNKLDNDGCSPLWFANTKEVKQLLKDAGGLAISCNNVITDDAYAAYMEGPKKAWSGKAWVENPPDPQWNGKAWASLKPEQAAEWRPGFGWKLLTADQYQNGILINTQ